MRSVEICIKNTASEQLISIPAELRIDDDKVYIKKVGNSLQIIPFHSAWNNLEEGAKKFSEDFLENRTQPNVETRQGFDR